MVVLPAGLRRGSDVEAIRDDIEPYAGTTVGQRSEVMSALCRFAAEQVAASARGADILAYQDPRSPASLALWTRLVAQARRG